MSLERVTVEGENLRVTTDQPTDPMRKRPPRLSAEEREKRRPPDALLDPVRSPSGWTLEEMINTLNPFHPEVTE